MIRRRSGSRHAGTARTFRKAIPHPPHGFDDAGVLEDWTKLMPEALHEGVDTARGDERAAPPHRIQERLAVEHTPRMSRQEVEQLELLLREP